MTDLEAMLRAIIDRPDDDLQRLVYADWLDEHDTGIKGLGLRAAFIRWQIRGDGEPCGYLGGIPYNLGWFVDKRHLWGADRLSQAVRELAGNLKPGNEWFGCYSWDAEKDRSVYTETGAAGKKVRLTYRRGFVDEISAPFSSLWTDVFYTFYTRGEPTAAFIDLVACQPIRRVSVTGFDPVQSPAWNGGPIVFWWPFMNTRIPSGPARYDTTFQTAEAARNWLSLYLIGWARKAKP